MERKHADSATGPLVNLSPEELLRLPTRREGFLEFAEPVFALYEANQQQFAIDGQAPAGARQVLSEYEALLARETALEKELQLVRETRALRGATVWTLMLHVYALARAVGRTNATLQRAISLFAHFMKQRNPRKPKVAPTAT